MLTTQIHRHPDAPAARDSRELGVPHVVRDEPVSEPIPAPAPKSAGKMGRYRIDSVLGRGGMGVVYSARDTKLARRVAIKLVRRRGSKRVKRAHERLRREAQALARLSHPNLVCVHDFGSVEQGFYIVMEYIDGLRIDQHLRACAATWQEVVAHYIQAGMGLEAAHAQGIVHRDFKPSNVLVGSDGRVRVLDFGLARTFDDESREGPDAESSHPRLDWSRLTDVNVILGTAGYMAPEQVFGQPIGAGIDQFSFCVALYEALYGHRPYEANNVLELGHAFRSGELRLPEKRCKAPRELFMILKRGLAIDSRDRHDSMSDLLELLTRTLVTSPARVGSVRNVMLLVGTASVLILGTRWVLNDGLGGATLHRAAARDVDVTETREAEPESEHLSRTASDSPHTAR